MSHLPNSIDVANKFLNIFEGKNQSVRSMKLMKLVYLSHAWKLGLLGEPMVSDDVQAWKYGPVFRKLYNCVRDFKNSPVTGPLGRSSLDVSFTEDDDSIISQVSEIYGEYTGLQLSDLTHQQGTPWDITTKKYGESAIIPQDLIEDHFAQKAGRELESPC